MIGGTDYAVSFEEVAKIFESRFCKIQASDLGRAEGYINGSKWH